MPITFPSSPSNGQSYSHNGIKYLYNSTKGYWSSRAEDLASAGIQVTADSTITISAGSGLTGGGSFTTNQSTSESITLNTDLSTLTTSTSNTDGDYFVVVDSVGSQKKLTKANIAISGFNNDAGYITSADGGNAATLDGLDSTQFIRSDSADAVSGSLTFNGSLRVNNILLDGAGSSGTSGYVLKSTGTGISWAAESGGGSGVTTGKAIAMAMVFG